MQFQMKVTVSQWHTHTHTPFWVVWFILSFQKHITKHAGCTRTLNGNQLIKKKYDKHSNKSHTPNHTWCSQKQKQNQSKAIITFFASKQFSLTHIRSMINQTLQHTSNNKQLCVCVCVWDKLMMAVNISYTNNCVTVDIL